MQDNIQKFLEAVEMFSPQRSPISPAYHITIYGRVTFPRDRIAELDKEALVEEVQGIKRKVNEHFEELIKIIVAI